MFPKSKILATAGAAIIAALALTAPTAAQAAPACESGMWVAPTGDSAKLFPEPVTDGTVAVPLEIGILTAPLCAATGVVIPAESDLYLGSIEVVTTGTPAFVKESQTVMYPSVDPASITEYAASRDSQATSILSKAAESKPNIYATPFAGLMTDPARELQPGDVIQVDSSVTTLGTSKLGAVTYWPTLLPDGTVGWVAADTVVALPSKDAPLGDFTIPGGGGFVEYDDPTDASPKRTLEKGKTVQASTPAGGWMRSSAGWIKVPGDAGDESDGEPGAASGLWDKAKDKAGELKDAAGEKLSEVTSATKDTAAETAARSKTLTMPQMVLSAVLSVLAIIAGLAAIFVRKAKGGFRGLTPAQTRRKIIGMVAAPVSLGLALPAIVIAPAAWSFSPWLSAGAGVVAVIAFGIGGFRLRGAVLAGASGEIISGMHSVKNIGSGVIVLAAGIGSLIATGAGSWAAYVVAAGAGVAVWAGACLASPGTTRTQDMPGFVLAKPSKPAPEPATDPAPAPVE